MGENQRRGGFIHQDIGHNNTWRLEFTQNFSNIKIEFLDLLITIQNEKFNTSTHKKVDTNSYLAFNSGHYKSWKTNIPYGQYRRIRIFFTQEETFEKQSKILEQRYKKKGYPSSLIKRAYPKAKNPNQKELLKEKEMDTEIN